MTIFAVVGEHTLVKRIMVVRPKSGVKIAARQDNKKRTKILEYIGGGAAVVQTDKGKAMLHTSYG